MDLEWSVVHNRIRRDLLGSNLVSVAVLTVWSWKFASLIQNCLNTVVLALTAIPRESSIFLISNPIVVQA